MPKSQQTKRRNGVRSPNGPNDNGCKVTNPPPSCTSKAQISSTPFSEDVRVDMSATLSSKSTVQDVRRHSPLGSSAPPKRYIPRPANSFMLFRKDYAAKHKGNKDKSIVMSQKAAKVWHHLPRTRKITGLHEQWRSRTSTRGSTQITAFSRYTGSAFPKRRIEGCLRWETMENPVQLGSEEHILPRTKARLGYRQTRIKRTLTAASSSLRISNFRRSQRASTELHPKICHRR
ncbi:hypothetical protein CPB85DRAFT_874406 [Mucidula mucida]|nr:hypothetical protein CPB85DRAFT_874406 [Mucidula mucida]